MEMKTMKLFILLAIFLYSLTPVEAQYFYKDNSLYLPNNITTDLWLFGQRYNGSFMFNQLVSLPSDTTGNNVMIGYTAGGSTWNTKDLFASGGYGAINEVNTPGQYLRGGAEYGVINLYLNENDTNNTFWNNERETIGDVTGPLTATVVGDDSHAHTGATLSDIGIAEDTNLSVTAPITLTGDLVGITIQKDIVVSGTGMSGGEDNVLPGTDADTTITLTVAKDLVAGNGMTGGEDNVLPGADADVTFAVSSITTRNITDLPTCANGEYMISDGTGPFTCATPERVRYWLDENGNVTINSSVSFDILVNGTVYALTGAVLGDRTTAGSVDYDGTDILINTTVGDLILDSLNNLVKVNADLQISKDIILTSNAIQHGTSNGVWSDVVTVNGSGEIANNLLFVVEGARVDGSERMPHFWIQAGNQTQASGVSRSFMIVDERVDTQNDTDLTSCQAYMDNVGEVLKIDCNTTTTGADLLVGDDMQVVGDVWLKNSNGEWRFTTKVLEELDHLQSNLIFNQVQLNYTASGETFHFSFYDDELEEIVTNINTTLNFSGKVSDSITLINGTDSTPILSYITYEGQGTPTLTQAQSYPSTEHVDVARILLGGVDTGVPNIYGFLGNMGKNEKFLYDTSHRFYEMGTLYDGGCFPDVIATAVAIDACDFYLVLDKIETVNNYSSADDNFVFVDSAGAFNQYTAISSITTYGDGGAIGVNKYYNIIWGAVPINFTHHRIYGVVQNEPASEHISIAGAEADTTYLVTFPNNDFIKKIFVPVARTVVNSQSDEIQTLSNGNLYFDIRGDVVGAGGSAPSPSITAHASLTQLDYASAGHTGFMPDTAQPVIVKENISNTGTLSFDWADSEVADDITASNYLPLAGGDVTGDINTTAGVYINADNKPTCYGADCDACTYWNSTHLVTESPCTLAG